MNKSTKIKLNIIRLLCIISLLISFLSIKNTFAKYYERVNTNYGINIKRWMIEVNDADIIEENDFSDIITPIYVENAHANQDVIVPAGQIYFDIEIDYTNVDVSFLVDFQIEPIGAVADQLSDLQFLKVVTVDENDVETEDALPYSIEVTGNEEEKVVNLRIYFEWYDGQDENMNDEEDTEYADDHTDTEYRATAMFTQDV